MKKRKKVYPTSKKHSFRKKENNKLLNNQREYESLNLYINYFSRWKELAQKSDYKIYSFLDIFRKTKEYNNREVEINIYAIISQIEKKDENNHTL